MNLWSQRYIFFLKEKGFKGKMCFHKACEEESMIKMKRYLPFFFVDSKKTLTFATC